MSNQKTILVTNEYYHVFARGVEIRKIVIDEHDIRRFLESLKYFNTTKRINSLYEHSFRLKKQTERGEGYTDDIKPLVDIVAYNLLDNHYHLLLKQRQEAGISKFMQSFNGGYTKYFNNRHKRIGPLFQGKFRAEHIDDDNQLVYVSAYVNLNHHVHQLGSRTSKWGWRSSWEQYSGEYKEVPLVSCQKDELLSLRANQTTYCREARELAQLIAQKRKQEKIIEETFISHLEVGLPSE